MESETFLQLAQRLGYLDGHSIENELDLIVQISKMLTALRAKLLATKR